MLTSPKRTQIGGSGGPGTDRPPARAATLADRLAADGPAGVIVSGRDPDDRPEAPRRQERPIGSQARMCAGAS